MSINFLKGRHAILSVLALAGAVCFTSCGDEEDEEEEIPIISLEVNSLTMNVGGSGYLKMINATADLFTTDDEFITTIDQEGNVYAQHVGETTVHAYYLNTIYDCKITVEALYYTFNEPLKNFGALKSEIKNAETRELIAEDLTNLIFQGTESFEPLITYQFSDDKCAAATIRIPEQNYTEALDSEVKAFIAERYKLVGVKDGINMYGDANAQDDCSFYVYEYGVANGYVTIIYVLAD